jgi:hypothetical protein
MLQGFRSFMSRMKLDVLCSSSDWAFVMSEADALESEDPAGCVAAALRRARGRDARRFSLVAAELMRRAAVRRAAAGALPPAASPAASPPGGPAKRPPEERRIPEDCETP